MGRSNIPGTRLTIYEPINQVHDRTAPTSHVVQTWAPVDDRNRAAQLVRGANTSFNYMTGLNFRHVPMGSPTSMDNFYPYPHKHPTTAHIRDEPTYIYRLRATSLRRRS